VLAFEPDACITALMPGNGRGVSVSKRMHCVCKTSVVIDKYRQIATGNPLPINTQKYP